MNLGQERLKVDRSSGTDRRLEDTLELPADASLEEVKIAFKRQALKFHPDKGGSKDACRATESP